MKKIYLAGPDVFLPDAAEHGKKLKELCARYGFEGMFPLDNEISADTPRATAGKICDANKQMIKNCDIVVANLSPFRGPEPDSGTVWELGYAEALGKELIAYCSYGKTLREKTTEHLQLPQDAEKDHNGMHIEDFGMSHNLMFSHHVRCSTFEECLQLLSGEK